MKGSITIYYNHKPFHDDYENVEYVFSDHLLFIANYNKLDKDDELIIPLCSILKIVRWGK